MKKVLTLAIVFLFPLVLFTTDKFNHYRDQTNELKAKIHASDVQVNQVWESIGALEPQLAQDLNQATMSRALTQREFDSNDTLMRVNGLLLFGSVLFCLLACLGLIIKSQASRW